MISAALLALALTPPAGVTVAPRPHDDGRHLVITILPSPAAGVTAYEVWRTYGPLDPTISPDATDAWKHAHTIDAGAGPVVIEDEVDYRATVGYAVRAVAGQQQRSAWVLAGPQRPVPSWFDSRRWFLLSVVVGMGVLLFVFGRRARKKPMFVRRIPGIDAIEEAVGRATEMGRPVLYVPGIDEVQNIQTVASLLILGHVAEVCARYDAQIRVACCIPLTMVLAEEVVRHGFAHAGRPEAHRAEAIQFISAEQFAFAAGAVGIILREKPAANIYLGCFYGESLLLAEAGYVNKAIQIAGTAELTQLPFMIASCDYTLIGEELYAVSAYLTREPGQLATLKAADVFKMLILVAVIVGSVLSTLGVADIAQWIAP